MCCGDNPNEACGYPPKTIRATISVFICVVTFLVFVFLAVWFTVHKEYTNSMGIAGMMVGELGTVIGYYFGSKKGDVAIKAAENVIKASTQMNGYGNLVEFSSESEDIDLELGERPERPERPNDVPMEVIAGPTGIGPP